MPDAIAASERGAGEEREDADGCCPAGNVRHLRGNADTSRATGKGDAGGVLCARRGEGGVTRWIDDVRPCGRSTARAVCCLQGVKFVGVLVRGRSRRIDPCVYTRLRCSATTRFPLHQYPSGRSSLSGGALQPMRRWRRMRPITEVTHASLPRLGACRVRRRGRAGAVPEMGDDVVL